MSKGLEHKFLQRRYKRVLEAHEKKFTITNHQRNANQNHNGYHFPPIRMATIKKAKVSVGEGVEKLEPLFIASGNGNMHSHRGILTVLLQKSKCSITRGSSNFTAKQILKTTEKRDSAICTTVFITTRWKQAKCLLMAEEISKIRQIHTVKYYQVLKGMSAI